MSSMHSMDRVISPPSNPIGSAQSSSREIYSTSVAQHEEDLQTYGYLRNVDQSKDELIERLMRRVNLLNETLRAEIIARQNEKHEYTKRLNQFSMDGGVQELQLLKSRTDGDAYVLLLIDGDGLIFNNSLLSQGETGGKEAAGHLSTAVRQHLTVTLPDLPANFKLMVRVYANVKGLAQICTIAGIIEAPCVLEDFIRGFNGHKLHFDFVDVGSGKDRADSKIEALFALNLGNLHCRQIILGVSHDNGYARQLEDISDNPQSSSVYLLEGVPFERELVQLKTKFKTIKFDDLFRDTKINVHDRGQRHSNLKRQTAVFDTESITSSAETTASFSIPSHSGGRSYAAPTPPPEPILLTPSDNPKPMTWAKLASGNPPPTIPREILPLPPPTAANASAMTAFLESRQGPIPRNKAGQRIDPFYPTSPAEWRRIQQLHLCNIHHLRQECSYGDKCTHAHKVGSEDGGMPDGSLSRRDLEILSQVSRYAPCRNGSACDDVKCIFGHRCPVQENEGQSGKGTRGRECRHGKGCKFPDDMHGLDTRVVKVTKI